MIENDRQREKALHQIELIKKGMSGPQGSWLGGEENRARIMELRAEVLEYDRRQATSATAATGTSPADIANEAQPAEGG